MTTITDVAEEVKSQAEQAWNLTDNQGRYATARACGWPHRTATAFAHHVWEKLSPATQLVLVRYWKLV